MVRLKGKLPSLRHISAPHCLVTTWPLRLSIPLKIKCACAGKSRGWGIVEYETPEEVTFSAAIPCCVEYMEAWLGYNATSSPGRSCSACFMCDLAASSPK